MEPEDNDNEVTLVYCLQVGEVGGRSARRPSVLSSAKAASPLLVMRCCLSVPCDMSVVIVLGAT